MSRIVCFGEVLWDVFPNHKTIGGAPLNVALRLSSFHNDVVMVSAVGNDDDGKKILDYMEANNVGTDFVQINTSQKTSQVHVSLAILRVKLDSHLECPDLLLSVPVSFPKIIIEV